jgi:hypothetical protein
MWQLMVPAWKPSSGWRRGWRKGYSPTFKQMSLQGEAEMRISGNLYKWTIIDLLLGADNGRL